MKRGFLNTDKAKSKIQDASKDKGKGKAKEEIPADGLPLLDLHARPPVLGARGSEGHSRFIFRQWPRDPNGKHMVVPSGIHGKEAGNGIEFWGATLYDFFFVHRIPGVENLVTISTGSKLANAMRALGELEHAKTEIAWADREAYPREIPAWDAADAIVEYETRMHELESTPTPSQADTEDVVKAVADTSKDPANNESPRRTPCGATTEPQVQDVSSDVPIESPFHPSHYPSPWPLKPFESPTPFVLQQEIPIYLLPKKLYVHDPWSLVHTGRRHEKAERWGSKTDRVRTYTLSLPPEFQEAAAMASAAATAVAETEVIEIISVPEQETEGPTEHPAIRASLPKRPRRPTEVPEAHLYLSPTGRLGEGNHSIVYEAELELPRNLFCESDYCKLCLEEQIKIEVDRLKESGEWEERMNTAAKSYTGPDPGVISPDTPSSSSVELPPRYVGFIKSRIERVPMETVTMVDGAMLGEAAPEDAPKEHVSHLNGDHSINRHVEYQGSSISVQPNIQWQDPARPETICKHRAETHKPVPRTAVFRVAAKLSLPGDEHLAREAKNYLEFPAHFFQHWSGYNIVPPIHDPTPIGALVPQYFGYYTPDGGPKDRYPFCSPILLIEHCGTPIDISELCTDDRHECAALLFRFHYAGWLHASFAERNILMQERQPTCSPFEERGRCSFPHGHRRYSFRLIDFGRSERCEASGREMEQREGKVVFELL